MPNHVVLAYVANQREHHENQVGNSVHLADYAYPHPEPFLDLRPFYHCVAEYNCHLVLCPVRHVGAIDPEFAQPLIDYILRVSRTRKFDVIRLSVLSDHVHMFAALRPNQSPEYLALAIMNNTSYWFRKWNPGVFKVWDIPGFWAPSAFLRTAGAATSAVAGVRRGGKGPPGRAQPPAVPSWEEATRVLSRYCKSGIDSRYSKLFSTDAWSGSFDLP